MTPREHATQQLEEMIGGLQLPLMAAQFVGARLQEFPAEIAAAVREALSKGRGIFAMGKRGRGKTHLAAAVVREHMLLRGLQHLDDCWRRRDDNGWRGVDESLDEACQYVAVSLAVSRQALYGVVFRTGVEILDDIRRVFDGDGRRKTDVVDGYAEADLLVIDDLGMDSSKEFVRETFDSIVNHRWADKLPTVFTSNLTFDELDRHYNDHGRMTSRIAGMCDVVELVGEDRRKGAQ